MFLRVIPGSSLALVWMRLEAGVPLGGLKVLVELGIVAQIFGFCVAEVETEVSGEQGTVIL